MLKEKCQEKKLHFLDHGNIIMVRHLNASKFHLNKRGTHRFYLMRLLKLSLILQIGSLSYIAWLVITEKIVIPMTMIKLSLRSVQLVLVLKCDS